MYLDPPYRKRPAGGYGEYGYNTFEEKDMPRFCASIQLAHSRGAVVLISYSDSADFVRLFPGWHMKTLLVHRHVAGFGRAPEHRRGAIAVQSPHSVLTMRTLTIAIISDLHAFDDAQGKEDPSYLSVALPENEAARHPISGLLHLINKEGLRADLLLCAGDIGDKARPIAIKYAWNCNSTGPRVAHCSCCRSHNRKPRTAIRASQV